jgi:hypothetical protein
MKTKTNINQIAITGLTTLAVFFGTSLISARADNASDSALNKAKAAVKIESAFDRLDRISNAIEKTARFTATMRNADIEAYELKAAEDRLENQNLINEGTVRYQASMINEEADAHELRMAEERLENLNLAVEQDLRFIAPDQTETEYAEATAEDYLEYANNRVY